MKKVMIVLVLLFSIVFSQTIEKYSTELSYTYPEKGYVLKFRPFDRTAGTQRLDFVVAKKLSHFALGGYWKSQLNGNGWLGLMLSGVFKKGKIAGKAETRAFKGLDGVPNQFYFIPCLLYAPFGVGIGNFTLIQENSDPFAAVGPLVKIGDDISLIVSAQKDLFSEKNLFMMKVSCRLK